MKKKKISIKKLLMENLMENFLLFLYSKQQKNKLLSIIEDYLNQKLVVRKQEQEHLKKIGKKT